MLAWAFCPVVKETVDCFCLLGGQAVPRHLKYHGALVRESLVRCCPLPLLLRAVNAFLVGPYCTALLVPSEGSFFHSVSSKAIPEIASASIRRSCAATASLVVVEGIPCLAHTRACKAGFSCRCLEFCDFEGLSGQVFFMCSRTWALNTRIGSSGARAMSCSSPSLSVRAHTLMDALVPSLFPPLPVQLAVFSTGSLALSWVAFLVCPFWLTLMWLTLISLVMLLLQPFPSRGAYSGQACRASSTAIPYAVSRAWGLIGGPGLCLQWTPEKPRAKPRQRKCTSQQRMPCCPSRGHSLFSFLGFCAFALPVQVWAMPPGNAEALHAIRALTVRLPEPLPAANSPVSDRALGSPLATSSVGFAPPGGPFLAAGEVTCWPTALSQPRFKPQSIPAHQALRLAYPSHVSGNGTDDCMMGAAIYAPHFQTEIWAIYAPPSNGPATLLQGAADLLCDAFEGALDAIVPLVPQRMDGSAYFIAYPKILDASGSSGVAVIFDLSRVGGHFFAAIVSRVLTDGDITHFIRPLTHGHVEEFGIYIGESMTPLSEGEHAVLFHGTVITVLASHIAPSRPTRIDALFEPGAERTPLQHVLRTLQTPDLCVLFEGRRYVVRQDYHVGRTIQQAIGAVLDRPPDDLTLCSSFCFGNLDVQGHVCDRIVAVAALPAPSNLPAGLVRRDVWTFCDYRPLGLKPKAHLSHVHRVHIPSILALDGVILPPEFDLLIEGGTVLGDEVQVGLNSTLIFRAKPLLTSSPEILGPDEPSEPDDLDEGDNSDPDDNDAPGRGPPAEGPPSQPSIECRHSGSDGTADISRSRSPLRHDISVPSQVARTEVCLRTPTPSRQDMRPLSPQGLSGVALLESGPIQPLSAKQPDLTGDRVHFVDSDSVDAQLPRLHHMLHAPERRDGPLVPVDPEEVLNVLVGLRQDPPELLTELLFLVYAPYRVPETYVLPLELPCSIQHALHAVAECRDTELSARYPEMFVVEPQPSRVFAALITAPAWAAEEAIVLLDCRALNNSIFCMPCSSRINRESLCALAGLPSHLNTQVFVYGFPGALPAWQIVDVVAGTLIVFLPAGWDAPRRFFLEAMLRSPESWDAQADIPHPSGTHFFLLTDGMPTAFTIRPDQHAHYRDAVASLLRYSEQNMTLQVSRPRIEDATYQGFHVRTVAVATEAISRLPIPPARLRPPSWIVVFDLREIFRSFDWRLLYKDTILVQELLTQFGYNKPAGFVVAISGAPIEVAAEGPTFRLTPGLVLRVAYESDSLEGDRDPGSLSPSDTEDRANTQGELEGHDPSATPHHSVVEVDPDRMSDGTRSSNSLLELEDPEVMVSLHFGVLIPGFSLEHLELSLRLPMTTPEVMTQVQENRDTMRALDFPRLIQVECQPDPRWGIFLAAPDWAPECITVCIDLCLGPHQHRVFAALGPPSADRSALLELAGMSPHSNADVYCNDAGPIPADTQVTLHPGSLVSIVEANQPRPWGMTFSAMLSTHLPWDSSRPFPEDDDIDRFCITCAEGFFCFPLIPSRAHLYRDDIAVRIACLPDMLHLAPADPRQNDVSFFGRQCRTVVAVVDRSALAMQQQVVLGILDARRLFKGWIPIATTDGWIALADLHTFLSVELPRGFEVTFRGCDPAQDWVTIDEGRVIVALVRPTFQVEPDNGVAVRVASRTQLPDAASEGPEIYTHTSPDAPTSAQPEQHAPVERRNMVGDYVDHSLEVACRPPVYDNRSHMWRSTHDKQDVLPWDRASLTPVWTWCVIAILVVCGLVTATEQMLPCVAWDNLHGHNRSEPQTAIHDQQVRRPANTYDASILMQILVLSACVQHRRLRGPTVCLLALLGCALGAVPCSAMQVHAATAFGHPSHKGPVDPEGLLRPMLGAIPTPCRNWHKVPTDPCPPDEVIEGSFCSSLAVNASEAIVLDPSVSDTVLHEALWNPTCSAFAVAAATIEVLIQEFPPASFQGPVNLSLEQLVPGPTKWAYCEPLPRTRFSLSLPYGFPHNQPLNLGQLQLGFTFEDVHHLFGQGTALLPIAESRALCPGLARWTDKEIFLQLQQLRSSCKPGELLCYTDGSFTEGTQDKAALCGWACIFLDPHRGAIEIMFGSIPSYLCAAKPLFSPFLGEVAGLLAAALVATADFQMQDIHIFSDCVSALAIAEGRCSYVPGGPSQTMRHAFMARHALSNRSDTLAYVPGHSGTFGNELADLCAKAGAKQHNPSCGLEVTEGVASRWLSNGGPLLPWIGLATQSARGDHTLPPLCTSALGHDAWHADWSAAQFLEPFLPIGAFASTPTKDPPPNKAQTTAPSSTCSLTIATFNVLSLGGQSEAEQGQRDTQEGLALRPGRPQLLAEQLFQHGVHAVCLQETRCEPGTVHTRGFLRFRSGSQRGQWGTEWWFLLGHPLLQTDSQTPETLASFQESSFVVVLSDPRRLFVRYTCQAMRMLFIGLHAPHRATEANQLDRWWHDTHIAIAAHSKGDIVILAGDMNASVGSVPSEHVGTLGAEVEDDPGTALHAILRDFSLFLPSTWEDSHFGASHTYCQKRGNKACRPDFIGLPFQWIGSRCTSYLAPGIHAAHSCQDHVAAIVDVRLNFGPVSRTRRLRRRSVKVKDVMDPKKKKAHKLKLHWRICQLYPGSVPPMRTPLNLCTMSRRP